MVRINYSAKTVDEYKVLYKFLNILIDLDIVDVYTVRFDGDQRIK